MQISQGRDKLVLSLKGDVPLPLFSRAVEHFSALVANLTDEVGEGEIDWEIEHLAAGSATVTVRALGEDTILIDQTVRAYEQVGAALQSNEPVPYSPEVARHAYALTHLLNGKITSLQLGSPEYHYTVESPQEQQVVERAQQQQISIGVLTGEVRSLITAPSLRLSLYDDLYRCLVPCYLQAAQAEPARAAWRRRADVLGYIHRDPTSGRPLSVRPVSEIRLIDRPERDYRRARGVVAYPPDAPPPETIIRQLRDGNE